MAVIVALIAIGYCSFMVQREVTCVFLKSSLNLPLSRMIKSDITDNLIIDNIAIDDIFISVKTTRHYQYTRLPLILQTWYQLAKEQVTYHTFMQNIM